LKHCIERLSVLQSEGALQMADLPSALQYYRSSESIPIMTEAATADFSLPEVRLAPPSPVISLPETERKAISRALHATNGERAHAAKILGIGRTTLYRKMKEYGLG